MSEAHEHGGHPPAEEDVLASGKIYTVGVIALTIFFLGSLAAGLGMQALRKDLNPDGPSLGQETGKAKIGIVEQRLFENANMGPVWKEAAYQRLRGYGWVDKQKGIAHIPIDRAMEMVEKGARP